MNQENIDKLQSLIINDCRKRGDVPYIVYGGRSFTGNQLADEVANETEVGLEIIGGVLRLSIDLMSRGKEKID